MSHQRVSGFPETRADLWGGPGTSGEVWGTSGEVWETSLEPLDCLKIHSERSSGEVAGKLPEKYREILGSPGTFQKLGEPDSLSATRHNCLQTLSFTSKIFKGRVFGDEGANRSMAFSASLPTLGLLALRLPAAAAPAAVGSMGRKQKNQQPRKSTISRIENPSTSSRIGKSTTCKYPLTQNYYLRKIILK